MAVFNYNSTIKSYCYTSFFFYTYDNIIHDLQQKLYNFYAYIIFEDKRSITTNKIMYNFTLLLKA
jgi:hypothetical protein